MTADTQALRPLLAPRSVAIIGASEREGNRGGTAAGFLRTFGFAGDVYPVHPTAQTVAGYPAVHSIAELPAGVDVAVIALGAANVAAAVTELGAAGVPAAIVWAGGFAETGHDGEELQRELGAAAREAGVRLMGPNCLGVVNTALNFTGTFATWLKRETELLTSGISIVSQSGGLGSFAHAWSQAAGIGFRYMVSTGNALDVTLNDIIDYFIDDEGTKVILCYLEGTSDGPRLLDSLGRARAAGKPVVMLKVGHSAASAQAIAAHTGALAGETRVWDALLAAEGVIQVRSLEELLEVGHFLHSRVGSAPLAGDRVAILSFGGGMGVLAADQLGAAKLEVPTFSPELQDHLRLLVPEIASVANPIDLTPEAFSQPKWRALLPDVLRAIDESGEVDIVMTQFSTGESVFPAEVAGAVADLHRNGRVATVVHSRAAGAETEKVYRAAGAYVFVSQKSAADTLGLIADSLPQRRVDADDILSRMLPVDDLPSDFVVPDVADGDVLPEHEVHHLLTAAGFSTIQAHAATSRDEAVSLATSIGFPVVMKGLSERVTHRAAAGLVRLGIMTPADVGTAWDDLQTRGAEIDAELVGVMVEEQASDGVEILVSAITDPVFGPVISCGAGGVLTELIDDVAFARTPLDAEGALRLLDSLRITHHAKGLDLAVFGPAAVRFLVQFSRFVEALPWASYVVELNPVSITARRAVPLDGLIIVQQSTGTPARLEPLGAPA